MNEADFFRFCQENKHLHMERDADGIIHAMAPTGFETGKRNSEIVTELSLWNRIYQLGEVGDSSTGFTLPNGAVRSPDAAWISHERLNQTTMEDRQRFVHAVPEFVVEIRSKGDSMKNLREKMAEYMDNGVLLAWLIDLQNIRVEVYRSGAALEATEGFEGKLSGEEVLPEFEFDLKWMR
ncbi:MAG: Uma2 family endonuclease [Saprospiraceae bacterium]